MKIQETKILHRDNDLHIVEMLIADNPMPEPEHVRIYLVSHVTVKGGQSAHLAVLQKAALDDTLNVLEQQKQVCVSALGRPQ